MRTRFVIFGLLIGGAISIASLMAQQSPYPPAKPQTVAPAGSIARGAQLVMLGGCDDCHTPKLQGGVLDLSRRLSGHPANAPLPPEAAGAVTTNMLLTAWRGPWGLSLTANLTPDPETGIGKWTLADFKKTIRTGVDPTGYVLKPPMPIPGLQNVPDADLDAIFKFLKTLKPVKNAVGRTGK
jgi:mono/diheme cytochrome c family protein